MPPRSRPLASWTAIASRSMTSQRAWQSASSRVLPEASPLVLESQSATAPGEGSYGETTAFRGTYRGYPAITSWPSTHSSSTSPGGPLRALGASSSSGSMASASRRSRRNDDRITGRAHVSALTRSTASIMALAFAWVRVAPLPL